MYFFSQMFCRYEKMYYLCSVQLGQLLFVMFDKLDLKGRKELLESLRYLLLNEDELISDEWYSPEDFLKAVIECYEDALKKAKK